jgi:hypothetical protein
MNTAEFIENCKSYSHYQNIKPRPVEFDNWRKDRLHKQYSSWVMQNANCPSLHIPIAVPYKEIYEEVASNLDRFVAHRDYGESHGWKSICIHGTTSEETNTWNTPGYKYDKEPEYSWTDLANSCPITTQWLKLLPYRSFRRVRFMLLEPGGVVGAHRDTDVRELQTINVAINNPEDCNFYMEDAGTIPWNPGELRLIDIGRFHSVVNNSDTPRIHMIIHGKKITENIAHSVCYAYDKLLKQ